MKPTRYTTRREPFIFYDREFEAGRDRLRRIENASPALRVLGPVHEMRELLRIDHTGWHCDPLGDGDTVHGVVIQLPARDGCAQFVPAVSDPCNDNCYAVDFRDVYTAPGDDTDEAKRDCAMAADRLAELYAERERDYQTEEGARVRIEEARERIAAERKEVHALLAEMRNARALNVAAPAICAALRSCLARRRAAVSAAVKEIRDLTRNPCAWLEA